MRPFTFKRATTPAEAAAAVAHFPDAKFIAGGTNLLDLMKLQIETPAQLVDVNPLGLDRIEPMSDGGLRVGALVRQLVKCLRMGSERFGWSKRNAKPRQAREGQWLIGYGMAAAFRNKPVDEVEGSHEA